MKIKTGVVSIKAGPEYGLAEGQFRVYPSTFIRKPDSYGDVVAKGAFLETIKHWKESPSTLPGLWGHRMDDPDYYVAGALDMGEDDHGWWVDGEFDMDSPKGPQTYRLVKGGRVSQLSFAFDVLDEGQVELEDGTKANELRKLHVHEFSFVPIGANQDTSVVAIKALTDTIPHFAALTADEKATLLAAQNAISTILSRFSESADSAKAGTSGHTEAKDEEPAVPAKSDEPQVNPSVSPEAMHIIQSAIFAE